MARSRSKRAEVVAADGVVAQALREYLADLEYEVAVSRDGWPDAPDADLIIYSVSPSAAAAERRRAPRSRRGRTVSGFWLDAVQDLRESAPAVPILVTLPSGSAAADASLASGATDVIEGTVTPGILRRRLELIDAYTRAAAPPREAGRPAPGVMDVPLPVLRSGGTGRIDAQHVADYMRIPLRHLAQAIGLPYAGVHKTPDSPRVQEPLALFVRILEQAHAALGNEESVRIWLNRPLFELEDESPLAVMLAGEADAVETLLANARAGIPG